MSEYTAGGYKVSSRWLNDLLSSIIWSCGFYLGAAKFCPPFFSPYPRHLCRPCHNREKARGLGKYICQKCHAIIDEQPLIFKNDPYHPDHFNCNNCGSVVPLHLFSTKKRRAVSEYISYPLDLIQRVRSPWSSPLCLNLFFVHRKELTAEARELKGELYCLPCHDKMGVPICGACRRPIEGRVVNAMGKQWHVEVCKQHQTQLNTPRLLFWGLCIYLITTSWLAALKEFTSEAMTKFIVFMICYLFRRNRNFKFLCSSQIIMGLDMQPSVQRQMPKIGQFILTLYLFPSWVLTNKNHGVNSCRTVYVSINVPEDAACCISGSPL